MRHRTLLVGAVLALVLGPTALARASSGPTVAFTAHYTDPGDHLSLGGVDPTCPAGQISVHGTAYFERPVRMIDTASGCVFYDPIGQVDAAQSGESPALVFGGYIDDHLAGTLDGCGRGGFTMHQTHARVTSVDPAARTFRVTLDWVVQPGSGTGAFRGASGEGSGFADFTMPNLTAPPTTPNSGSYHGTISCPHHD